MSVPLVNEFLYDFEGRDGGHEFVEVCVAEGEVVDLTGWNLEYFGHDWRQLGTLDGMSVGPGEHLLVTVFTDGMWNGDEGTAAVRLVDDRGRAVDTVLYGAPNRGDVTDDRGEYAEGPDTPADASASLGRYPDCTDSNVSLADFVVYGYPTPGVENPALGRDTGAPGGEDSGRGDSGTPEPANDCDCGSAFAPWLPGAMLAWAGRRRRRAGYPA